MKMLSQLPDLQIEQQRHDELAHRDILNLNVQDRIKHMVLHFAKYSGHLAKLQKLYDRSTLESCIVDSGIICLACANALNVNLSELAQRNTEPFDLALSEDNVCAEYFIRYSVAMGSMAKACESLDHFERFDYRGTLENGLSSILCMTSAVSERLDVDLPKRIRARWRGIEQRLADRLKGSGAASDKLRLAANK